MGAVGARDGVESAIELIDGEADASGKLIVEKDELAHALGGDLTEVIFSIGLVGTAGLEDGLPLDGVDISTDDFLLWEEDVIF